VQMPGLLNAWKNLSIAWSAHGPVSQQQKCQDGPSFAASSQAHRREAHHTIRFLNLNPKPRRHATGGRSCQRAPSRGMASSALCASCACSTPCGISRCACWPLQDTLLQSECTAMLATNGIPLTATQLEAVVWRSIQCSFRALRPMSEFTGSAFGTSLPSHVAGGHPADGGTARGGFLTGLFPY